MVTWLRAVVVAALVGLSVGAGPAWAQDPEDVDPVALAAMLLSDGYWDRAATVLDGIDAEQPDLDLLRFLTLRGLVRAHQGLHPQAVEDFRAALALPDADPLLYLQLAQSLLATGDAAGAIEALDTAGPTAEAVRGAWMLRSKANLSIGDERGAWVALTRGAARFPDDVEFVRQQVFLLVRMGLFQEALVAGRALLARTPDDADAWLAFAEALRNAGEVGQAIVLLEEARLRFPRNVRLSVLLARLYLQDEHPGAAAPILQIAAEVDPTLYSAAAEAWRRAGRVDRALYLNAEVPDAAEKARQRLGLYIEAGDWARAVALQDRLDRLGLLDQDALRYALAYAWFQLGEVDTSEGFLKGIADPRYFRDATALREAMQQCRDAGWGCP
ncbi:MAG: tetratricopeptide repeat protein [Alphaproteobacteria bacterium]|nr:tetratricopeptide repeat protein [Alphaproteobacteria bacterium]